MKQVVGYIRALTDSHAGEDKSGLDAQRQSIIDYCAAHDMNIVKWYTDESELGDKERPGFDEIIYGDVANPPYEAVIAAKSDHVARDINIYYYYKMLLKKKEIQLISVIEDFGQMGAFASILDAFTLCVADMERNSLNRRTSGGRKAKAAKGGYSGGKPPYGYYVSDGRLLIKDDEATIVRIIFQRKSEGKSMMSTVSMLNEAGYRPRSGKMFLISHIQSILNNERTYKGEYKYGKDDEWVHGEHEPILK